MQEKHYFKIYKYCPKELIFDGEMTFTEARRFMDQNASNERRVGFSVFNNAIGRWEDFGDSYHGGRKVYDKNGSCFIIDPDYRNMWTPASQQWHLWFVKTDGTRLFCQSFKDEISANKRRYLLAEPWKEGTYIVEPSDIKISI